MLKRTILAVVATFLAWSVLDIVLHGLLLRSTYEATADLWRPMDQMNLPLRYVVTLVCTGGFTVLYALMVRGKSVASGAAFGALFGLVSGVSMGFGSYTYMPIPLTLALAWSLGTLVEATVAGVLVGAIIRPGKKPS